MKKHVRVFAMLAVCALALGTWAALYGQNQGNGPGGSTFLITITDANTGAFASQPVITLHGDNSVAAIDSGQEGGPVPFSSQQGVWKQDASGAITARTIDFSFPFATEGSARVDYTFNTAVPRTRWREPLSLPSSRPTVIPWMAEELPAATSTLPASG